MKPSEVAMALPHVVPDDAAATASFAALFGREASPMVRLAISLVDSPDRAEEIVQDAFERTLLAWNRVEQPGAYLRQAVVNGCRSELRRRRVVRSAPVQHTADSVAPGADQYLIDAVGRLTPKRRIALTLRFYADLPEAEIAELMGVRPGTVKSLISRGLADLRKVVAK